jgi:addiction module RelE/StbE family toxin
MKIYYSSKFAREYKKLPKRVKLMAEKKEKIFRQDPFDKRLKPHKLTGKLSSFWSFSVGYKYRLIFEFKTKNIIWFHSIGSHAIYR